MKILIADPDWNFARQASNYFESHAHLVVHETEARTALDRAESWRPDLVIVSGDLAESGLIEAIRGQDDRPAILLTDQMSRFDRAWRAWQHGGDDLLFKPLLHSSELHVALVTALENSVCPRRREMPAAPAALSA